MKNLSIFGKFTFLLFLVSLIGCKSYYKVQTVKPVTSKEIYQYDSLRKYFIVHNGGKALNIKNIRYNNEYLSGKLVEIPDAHMKYKTTMINKGNRYRNTKKHDESLVLNEIHLYLQDSVFENIEPNDSIKISFSQIARIEVYSKAKGKTIFSWLWPPIGGTILAVGIFAIIVGISINQGGVM